MSIKSDIDELRQVWADATVLTRAPLIVSMFLTVSSITSIAEVVVLAAINEGLTPSPGGAGG